MNYRIADFFLKRSRLTILCLLLLLTLGTVSLAGLKTTGFPAIVIPGVTVQTVYPGAAADTVAQQVTQPIEGALKDVKGIKTYTSQSSNSFSMIFVSLDGSVSSDTASSQIASAVRAVSLPSGAESPKVAPLEINAPSFIVSVAGKDLAQDYAIYQKLQRDVSQLPETASVKALDDLQPRIDVTLDQAKLAASGLTLSDVQAALRSVDASIPVTSSATLDGKNTSISVGGQEASVADLRALTLKPGVTLGDVASVTQSYAFATAPAPAIAYHTAEAAGTLPAVTLQITAAKNTDSAAYAKKVREIMQGYSDASYRLEDPELDAGKPQIVEHYSADTSNREQVSEVQRGLVGGPLPVDNKAAKQLGWLLGGIQLVFLVMMLLVSWRAALVSSLAIPLSLLVSTIYLHAAGYTLNTIVLFSLVLAIGIVVDPALVVLESVQRKIDAGHRGKEAVLLAIKDVGAGLFVATLNNIIVFLPFGVVSGAIGDIFRNIPAAIIPALIGSYVVPLIFLAWAGGVVLRPGKRTGSDEEKNLWPFAAWLIRFNEGVLHGSVQRRVVIILLAAVLPLAVAGYYFGTGKITFTQFSGGADSRYVNVSGSFRNDLSKERKQADQAAILDKISQNPHLGALYAFQGGFSYQAYVRQGDSYPASSLSNDIAAVLDQYKDDFFDRSVAVEAEAGGGDAAYQVQIAVKSEDGAKLEAASKEVGAQLANACLKSKKVTLDAACAGGTKIVTKVDDGYTGKEGHSVQVALNRAKLSQFGLDAQGNQVVGVLASRFPTDSPTAAGKLLVDGAQINIYLSAASSGRPATLDEVKALPVGVAGGAVVRLSDVASVVEVTTGGSIAHERGQRQNIVQARLADGHNDQGTAAQLTTAAASYFNDNDGAKTTALGLAKGAIGSYSQGGAGDFAHSFTQLLEALVLAIFATYFILVVFFESFLQPIIVLFTIPLTFIGIFPALYYMASRQFGFFEIIGLIILVGLVDNVAIFLIDAARQRMAEGMEPKDAIAHASGIRLRPVILTKLVALASLAPLAILSPFYRSISLVIMFGLLTSGLTSLFTTPILFIFFRWLSDRYLALRWWSKVLFFPLAPFYLVGMGVAYKRARRRQK